MPAHRIEANSDDGVFARGCLVDQNGCPVAGATVDVRFLNLSPHSFFTFVNLDQSAARTDATGQFSLPSPQQDDSQVWGLDTRPNYWREGRFLLLATKDHRFVGFTIASGKDLEQESLRISALPTADIEGQVIDETGRPICGVLLAVDRYELDVGPGCDPDSRSHVTFTPFWTDHQSGSLRTSATAINALSDGEGRFVIPQVPVFPGQFHLSATHPDFVVLESKLSHGRSSIQLPLEVGSRIGLHVRLPDGRPACGFSFRANSRDGVTDTAGICEFSSLAAGECYIRFEGEPTREWAVPDILVSELTKGERREIAALAVRGSILCGQVLDAEAKEPGRNLWMKVEGDSYPVGQVTHTDINGRFEFAVPIAAGRVDVRVEPVWSGGRQSVLIGQTSRTELTLLVVH